MEIKKYSLNNSINTAQTVSKKNNAYKIKINNELISVNINKIDLNNQILFFSINQEIYKANILTYNKNLILLYVHNLNKVFNIKQNNFNQSNLKTTTQISLQESLKSPLAGKVIKIHPKENQFVLKNQPLVIIESMKMENEILAPHDTFIKNIQIIESDLVKQNQILMKFENKP
ncbi:hypothetical protein GF322_02800 [Candidatus Dependentiae bacterium]|nr:hypothetical protein [Candidatus Dependentiae bacterium]